MENSLARPDVSGITKKPRSLDLQSLYVEKSRASIPKGGAEDRVLNRKRKYPSENEGSGLGHGKKKRKSRKEVSLSSFEPADKKSRKSSNAVGGSGLSLGSSTFNNPALKLSRLVLHQKAQGKKKKAHAPGGGNQQNLGSLSVISDSLDDNIPKRPRGLSRRKRFQNNHVSEQVGTSSSKVGYDARVTKLINDSVTSKIPYDGKQKKASEDFKENSSSRANSTRRLKAKDGGSVRHNGDPTSKDDRRNQGKRRESASKKQKPADEIELLVNNSAKTCGDLQEDDEENLEQNAARMLSSRFDPSCTGFTGNNKASSTPQSRNGLSPVSSFRQELMTPGMDNSAGFTSTSADAAGRVLRPRKQHKGKGLVRKRRHFYEIFSRDLDAYWVLNRRIKVFWPLDQSWYFGLVTNYDPERKLHHVKYDDRDEEWINLHNERFKLLLLTSEVPGKSGSEISGQGGKKLEDQDDVNIEDGNCAGSYMDSEPIISWLARSTHRFKSSPLGRVKKQKTFCQAKKSEQLMFSDDYPAGRCLGVNSARTNTNKSHSISVSEDRPAEGEVAERSTTSSITYPNDRKPPFVYFRKRFCKRGLELGNYSEKSSGCRSLAVSVSILASVVDRVGALEVSDVTLQGSGQKALTDLDRDTSLWSGLLKSTFQMMKLKQGKLKLNFPLHQFICNHVFNTDFFWLHHALMLLQFGMVVVVWPKVQLEMLFVDNVVGLRFMLFEGCLIQAVAFMCLVLNAFHQPDEHGRLLVDLQLPVTSIRFKLSGFRDMRKQFVFMAYNFLEVKNSKWLYLDYKLKKYCSVTKQLPLAECTYDNIKVLQSGYGRLVPLVPEEPIMQEGLRRKCRQGIMHMGVPKESVYINPNFSSSNFNERHWRLPPFILSFSAAPSFFLSLHLKLLMDNNVASMSFQNHNSMSLLEGPENCGREMVDEYSSVEDLSKQVQGATLENNVGAALRDAASSTWLSCAKPKVETDAISISNDGTWIRSSQKYHNSELNLTGTSVGPKDSGKEIDGIIIPQRHPPQCSVSEQSVGKSRASVSENQSSPDRSETGYFACLNGVNVQIPHHIQIDSQLCDGETPNSQQATFDLPWNMNDLTIRSPNPTAPRSAWHRNRHRVGSSSFGRSKNWMDEGADFIHNGLGNGSRKPRTQVSYVSPFGGYDLSSKPRSHLWKGRSHKRIRNDNGKMVRDGSGSPQRYIELLPCEANLLITIGDRGWRECGAQIVLEFVDHKDWRLLVKASGATKYSFKAHQFLQPGTTNRYTHVMMWKGGKDWTLEFPDRSQWTLFREMHEECYNRNMRAATVKNIPIPGVRLIEDNDDLSLQTPFVHSSPKYFRQVENDVEMALNPSCVLYDMDSEDEEWVSRFHASDESEIDGHIMWCISEEMFERTMDMIEKVAYSHQRDDFTSSEIEELVVGVGPSSVIKAIHEHWLQKRQRKGMPLIRQFQPPLWERYQKQVKDWEVAVNKRNNFANGCKEKAAVEKPPMFAFCLRPRGLEVPNKGPKHRSQRKFTSSGWHSNTFSRDQDGVHGFGRKLNGFVFGEERSVVTGHNHESLDSSTWLQTSTGVLSPRDAVSAGYLSMSSDGSERNWYSKFNRNKSKKIGTFLFPNESQVAAVPYNQRLTSKRNGACQWNMGLPGWPSQRQYQPEGSQRQRVEQLGCSDLDEFRLRDASGAAQHASNMAKLKWEKAQRLLYRADLAIHKAEVALMTAEAIKASESTEDG